MQIQSQGSSAPINQAAQHTLFVEGSNDDGFDTVVLKTLLRQDARLDALSVKALGSCSNMRSAAEALFRVHPTYYFLIDRDDHPTQKVERSWRKFPDPNSCNILILRKRELENYFIDPAYLAKAKDLDPNFPLEQKILDICNDRIFIEATNLTLYSLDRKLKRTLGIRHFTEIEQFQTYEDGLQRLQSLSQIPQRQESITELLEADSIAQIYQHFIQELTNGVIPLEYDQGNWLERMAGKEIFEVVASQAFRVLNQKGTIQQGKKRMKLIAKDLVRRLPLAEQPQDFQELVELLADRLQSA